LKFAVLLLLAPLLACGRPTPVPVTAPHEAPAPIADPLLGTIDGLDLHLSHVCDRLVRLPPTLSTDDAALRALIMAAEDLLAVREMHVLKQAEQPGERPWQAAERFAVNVWRGEPTCEADPGEVKMLYMQQLARFKHPAKFAIWDAQMQCCPDPDKCPPAELTTCRDATLPHMRALAKQVRERMQALPPLGLAADVTDVDVAHTPVQGARTDAFEAAVAGIGAQEPRLQLRRYDFYKQGEPGMEGGRFRAGEPSVAQWVETAHLGDVSQPTETVWGWSLVLLAAREPMRSGKADPVIMAQLNAAACLQMAERLRQEWRDGLLRAALMKWDRPKIEAAFGAAVTKRLPQNAPLYGGSGK
jgi:hypothetical protein